MGFIEEYNLAGLVIGLATFLIIGLFHPLVIKGEYYWGQKCKIFFWLGGFISLFLSVYVSNQILSILWGVVAFSCFWSIKEVSDQKKRVEKGWFPKRERK